MKFNIKKYDDRTFHEDELNHKRIKALLLWYEYNSEEKGLDEDGKMDLLTNIIDMCVRQEWYEIANFFNGEKSNLEK